MDKHVKQLLKMVEADEEFVGDGRKTCAQKKPELIACIEEFSRMYQSMAEHYELLVEETQKSMVSETKAKDFGSGIASCGLEQESQLLTPYQTPCLKMDHLTPFLTPREELNSQKSGEQGRRLDMSLSSGGGSSGLSPKEGAESSSSSMDSESESSGSSVDVEETGLGQVVENLQGAQEDQAIFLKAEKNNYFEELLGKLALYEEKLEASSLKLQLSEKEVERLRIELGNSEMVARDYKAQFEEAERETKMVEENLKSEKQHLLQLEDRVAELESSLSQSNELVQELTEELDVTRRKLKDSDEVIAKLNSEMADEISQGSHQLQCQLEIAQEQSVELESKLESERKLVLELQERIENYEAEASHRENEVQDLEAALCDAHEELSLEKTKLNSELCRVVDNCKLLEANLGEWELKGKALEDKLRQYEAEMLNAKQQHDVKERERQCEINKLNVDLLERNAQIEALNKEFDRFKLKYDTLMAERDEIIAKVQKLEAEVSSRDDKIREMEECVRQKQVENADLIDGSLYAQKVIDRMKMRVEKLEKEADELRSRIEDTAEEKREAIRQLCSSIEYYRSGNQELRQAFGRYCRRATAAS